MINGTDHPYGYLNQEEQNELGLNWLTFRYRNYMPEIGRFFGVDPVSSEYMSISTYQFAHNNPIWKVELEGLEGQEKQGVDVSHHEPVKVVIQATTATGVGVVGTKVVTETTKKAAIELSKSYIDDAGRLVMKGSKATAGTALATLTAFLTSFSLDEPQPSDYMKPLIDEKLQVDDKQIETEGDSDSPIRRLDSDDKVDFLMGDSEKGESTKGRAKLFDREGGLGHAVEAFYYLEPENVKELDDGTLLGTLKDGRKVNVRPKSSDGRPTLEIQDGKKRIKFRFGQTE